MVRIRYSTQEGVQKKSPSSPELSRFNGALLRHYCTKRMTILKFELFFRMRSVRSPRMDGMCEIKNRQRWYKSIQIFGSSTMFFFVTSHQLLFCILYFSSSSPFTKGERASASKVCVLDLIISASGIVDVVVCSVH
jgi:hypothetical protein